MARDKRLTPIHNKPEELPGRLKPMPYRHLRGGEWPYMAGATCLVALLLWQPFQPPALAVMFAQSQPSPSALQRSLQEIDSTCYQVRSEEQLNLPCHDCNKDKATDARSDQSFQFSRSILTCGDIYSATSHESGTNIPNNMRIEVLKANHSF